MQTNKEAAIANNFSAGQTVRILIQTKETKSGLAGKVATHDRAIFDLTGCKMF